MASSAPPPQTVDRIVLPDEAGQRLDVFLARVFSSHSRSHLRRIINAAQILVDGQQVKAAFHLRTGQRVSGCLPELPRDGPVAEEIPLSILYEDDCLVVIDKPSGMVVHPAKGHWQGTLASALAFHFEQLSTLGGPTRPGIVHRLDRETSGVIVVAKTDAAHRELARQFEQRTIHKEYFSVLQGVPDRDRDVIDQPLGMHPYQREKMAIRAGHSTSRAATTFYEVSQRFGGFAAVKIFPKTGRTHQIRVHMRHVGHPVLCDRLYGGRSRITNVELGITGQEEQVVLERLALHAHLLRFEHPQDKKTIEVVAPLPDDLKTVLHLLR